MNQDLEALSLIQNLSSDEFERFKAVLRILTSKTFIIRGIEKERELYAFTIQNIALFEAWFSCMDASLTRDESAGVIAFRGAGNTRLHFTQEEICAALTLRLLYEDKKIEVFLTAFPAISIGDFQQKFNAMTGEEIKKTALIRILSRFSSCKLISVESQDYADPEGLIQLYPSIPLSIDRNALDEAMAFLEKREKRSGDDDNEDADFAEEEP
ncbi:MAG: DUF4194 domain-containing protein [Treponema sp.]|jgi:hypothetical protein|nr:DUF4194 domain-containing protein [Treponema sp.]